ncbi:MAG: hypothetical protein NC098_07000 [Lachnoclostridium sp.]|nr:hypothetical protein [Lachnoclostridium sp.]
MHHNDLILCTYIFSSDDDGCPVQDIYSGYDEKFNLIILLEHTDYDLSEYNCHTYAIITKHQAYRLARRLQASMIQLPTLVSDCVDDSYYEITNPSIRDTRECFTDILASLAEEKCPFRIIRHPSVAGYTCY